MAASPANNADADITTFDTSDVVSFPTASMSLSGVPDSTSRSPAQAQLLQETIEISERSDSLGLLRLFIKADKACPEKLNIIFIDSDLNASGFGVEVAESFTDALRYNLLLKVTHLSLRDVEIGDAGAEALGGALVSGEYCALNCIDLAGTKSLGTDWRLWFAAFNGDMTEVTALLKEGPDVDKAMTYKGLTPLHVAAANGHFDVVRVLLEKGADKDKARTDTGATPLYVAAESGHEGVVKALLGKEADKDKAMTDTGATPLYAAAKKGHLGVVTALLKEGADKDKARTDTGATPLYAAAKRGHVGVVTALLKGGADKHKATTNTRATPLFGVTPLFIAAAKGREEVVRVLLEEGADPDKGETQGGTTPLFIAAEGGNTGVVLALLAKGADPDKVSARTSATPLCIAAQKGHLDVVYALLFVGAKKEKGTTDTGETPLYIAAEGGHLEVVMALLSQGADKDKARTDMGATPLCIAAEKGHLAIVNTLLEKGADGRKASERTGFTALHYAANRGHLEVVRALIAKQKELAEFAIGDKRGLTALHLAAYRGHLQMVELLIQSQAPVNQTDAYGRTALHFCAMYEEGTETSLYLLNQGAELTKLDKELAAKLLGKLGIAPILVYEEQFKSAMSGVSVVAGLVATVLFVAWSSPPGGFQAGLSMLDPQAVSICKAAVAAAPSTLGAEDCERYHVALLTYFVFVAIGLFSAIGSIVVTLIVAIPQKTKTFFEQADINTYYLYTVVSLLVLALVSALGAFTAGAFAVLPTRFIGMTSGVCAALLAILVVIVILVFLLPYSGKVRRILGGPVRHLAEPKFDNQVDEECGPTRDNIANDEG